MILISRQISELLDAFRNKLSVYKVTIVRNVSAAGPLQRRLMTPHQGEREQIEMTTGEPVRSSGRKRKAVRRYENEATEERERVNAMVEDEDPLEVPSSSIAGPEPDFIYNMPQVNVALCICQTYSFS